MSISTYFKSNIHQKGPEILRVKVEKNPTWPGSSILLDALFYCKEGLVGPPLKNVMANLSLQ
jgi:hypothetical protein